MTTEEPKQVERKIRSKIEIISSDDETKVMERYDKFVNHLLTYGAIIKAVEFSTAAGGNPEDFFVQFSVSVGYEVPLNVTDEMIAEGRE